MSGPGFSLPSNRFSLGNYQLHLDPVLMREMQALQKAPPSAQLRNLFLHPRWFELRQSDVDRVFRTPMPGPTAALVPRGAGPSSPKAAEVADLMKAIWAIPAVKSGTGSLLDLASRKAKSDWNNLSGGNKAMVISWSGLIAGPALVAALSDKSSRKALVSLVAGRDFDIPKLTGATFQIREKGAGVNFRNIGNSGVGVQGGAGMGASGGAQFDFMLTLDLARYFPR